MKRLILDRDGVINEDSPDYRRSVRDGRPLPGSVEAIARLCTPGFEIVVATNKSAPAQGLFGRVVRRGDSREAVCESGRACGP